MLVKKVVLIQFMNPENVPYNMLGKWQEKMYCGVSPTTRKRKHETFRRQM